MLNQLDCRTIEHTMPNYYALCAAIMGIAETSKEALLICGFRRVVEIEIGRNSKRLENPSRVFITLEETKVLEKIADASERTKWFFCRR